MLPAIALLLVVSAHPSEGCCASISSWSETATAESENPCWYKCKRECDYYNRVYYGHYDRQPFDYRFQFDYPSAAGPSQAYWPIPPLAPGSVAAWNEIEQQARRSPRVNIAARPLDRGADSPGTSWKLRK